jgi:DNA recombination protein RmuC
MGTSAILFALIAVGVFFLGLWAGLRFGRVGVQVQLDEAKKEIRELRPKVEELAAAKEREKAQEEKYAQMKADVDKAFGSLAAEALRANNQTFLSIAKQELGGQTNEAKQALEAKEAAIRKLLEPLEKALKSLDEQARAMENTRSGAYSEVKTMVEHIQKAIPASLDALRNETAQLVTALRAPKTRGNWGELQLKRCVEYAGMVQYCSFSEQVTARDDDDKMLRPDMTIQLPNGREIVVDAKTPLDAFLDASGNADPAAQNLRFEAHAQRVKAHLKELSGKAYWKQFEKAPDFVVCFLPSEALFSAALEADPSLIEFGTQSNVVMATPTTLIALLRAVEFGWQQAKITKNAREIQEMGRKIYEKLANAYKYVNDLGGALGNSIAHYNKFIGAIEGRDGAFSWARKLHALEYPDDELDEIEPLQPEMRELKPEKWSQPLLVGPGAEELTLALAAEAEEGGDEAS